MSARAAKAPSHPGRLAILAVLLLLALAWGATLIYLKIPRERLVVPDEKAAAAALLAQKLSGPSYFQAPPLDAKTRRVIEVTHPGESGPLLTEAEARTQVARIVRERGFDAGKAARLHGLIDQLAQPSTSRVVGEPVINLLRLNLALDELR